MSTEEELRAQYRRLLVIRQIAALVAIAGFVVVALILDDAWMWDFVVMLGVFFGAGFALWAGMRIIPPRWLVLTTLLLDVVIVSVGIARTPHAAELAMAFLAIIAVASMLLAARAAVLVTLFAIGFGTAAVAVIGDDDQLAPTIVSMIMLATVAIVLIGVRRDERRTRQLLQRNERQLQRAETVAGMGSWQWCPATNELVWSRNMFRLLGRDPDGEQPDYETWTSGLPPERLEVMEQHARATLETGEDYSFDSVQQLPTGQRLIIRARGSRVVDEDGKVWLVGTAQDVTELRRVDELKDEFVATASHELRTPATIILGSARTLDDRWDDLDDDTRRTLVTQLRAGGERMSQLIEDVLSLSRIEHGELQFEPRPIVICDVIGAVVDELSSPRVRIEVDPSIDGTSVLVDPERMRQVIYNLVENALRYDQSDGPVHVEVLPAHGDARATHVAVRVRDHGPGVAAADRERIFDRFVRGTSTTRSDGGTGLGLYVARSLVERQGGRLWIEEPPEGNGSVFGFTVPRA